MDLVRGLQQETCLNRLFSSTNPYKVAQLRILKHFQHSIQTTCKCDINIWVLHYTKKRKENEHHRFAQVNTSLFILSCSRVPSPILLLWNDGNLHVSSGFSQYLIVCQAGIKHAFQTIVGLTFATHSSTRWNTHVGIVLCEDGGYINFAIMHLQGSQYII